MAAAALHACQPGCQCCSSVLPTTHVQHQTADTLLAQAQYGSVLVHGSTYVRQVVWGRGCTSSGQCRQRGSQ